MVGGFGTRPYGFSNRYNRITRFPVFSVLEGTFYYSAFKSSTTAIDEKIRLATHAAIKGGRSSP